MKRCPLCKARLKIVIKDSKAVYFCKNSKCGEGFVESEKKPDLNGLSLKLKKLNSGGTDKC